MHICCWKDCEYRKVEKKRFSIISPARYKPKCNSDYVLLIFFLYIYYLPKLFNSFHSLPFLLNIVLKNIPFYVSKKFSKVILCLQNMYVIIYLTIFLYWEFCSQYNNFVPKVFILKMMWWKSLYIYIYVCYWLCP